MEYSEKKGVTVSLLTYLYYKGIFRSLPFIESYLKPPIKYNLFRPVKYSKVNLIFFHELKMSPDSLGFFPLTIFIVIENSIVLNE